MSTADEAVQFLTAYIKDWSGYMQVIAIGPDKEGTVGAAVAPTDVADLTPFIEQHNGKRGVYFCVNPLKTQKSSKANKGDILEMAFLHTDLDPAGDREAGRGRIRQAIDASPLQPTFVVDSGNGYGLFWRLKAPVTQAIGEDLNKRLAQALGGDSCHNCDRLMRMPGTLNLPNATKKLKGYEPVQATLIESNDNAYTADDFADLPHVKNKTMTVMPPTSPGEPIRLEDYGLDERQQALVNGTLAKGTRSEVMHSLLIILIEDGHSRDRVLGTLYAEPGLWRGYLCDKHPANAESFALSELEKAWQKTMPGLRAGLAYFNPAWGDEQLGQAPFTQTPLAVAIRFDARPTTLEELDAEDPPMEYVIEPIYPLATPGEFAGAHGIGKSINGLAQCCCVATGRPWNGLSVMQGKVVFASWEDPRKQIRRRVKTWLRNIANPLERAKAKRAIAENLIILGCDEIDLMLTTKAFGACSVRDDVIDLIAERCQGAVLVMLETAALMHGGDELNEDLAQLAKAVKLITNRTGAAVIVIRHVSQDAARNRIVDSYVGRGGTSFTGAMRTMVVLVDVPEDVVIKKCIGSGHPSVLAGRSVVAFHHTKANYGDKRKEPIYMVVMPDGHMEHITGPDAKQAHKEQLLEWMRENVPAEGLSFTKIRAASKKHGVKQDMLRIVLEALKNDKAVKRFMLPSRGASGESEMWQLVELV